MKLSPAIDSACLWFADGILKKRQYRNREFDWVMGYAEGKLSASKFVIQAGLTKSNRRAIGRCIAAKLQMLSKP